MLPGGRPAVVALATLMLVGCASVHAATTSANRADVVRLRALERPVLRSLKQTFIAVAANRQPLARMRLELGAAEAETVVRWLDSHEAFVRANRDALSCLDDSLHELGEQADRLGPLLSRNAARRGQRTRLEHTLGEAANCIEASG